MSDIREQLESELERQGGRWGRIAPDRWKAVERFGGESLLDVGCSGGAYVTRLRKTGKEAFGADLLLGSEWRQMGNWFNIAEAHSLPLRSKSLETIIAFEALEHLQHPLDALREWKRIATRNVILSVPNCDTPSALRSAGFTFHHWTDRTHVNFFTRESLIANVTEAGFRVTHVEPIRQTSPGLLLLLSLGLPPRVAGLGGRILRRLARHQFHMSLLVVADVE